MHTLRPAMPDPAPFLYTTCNVGSEASLKAEVARTHPGMLTPAFMRPGLITWKVTKDLPPDFALRSVFARVTGTSLGLGRTQEEISQKVAQSDPRPLHLHVFPRLAPEDEAAVAEWQRIDALRAEVAARLSAEGVALHPQRDPSEGEWILDLIVEPDSEQCLAGLRCHASGAHPLPGGLSRVTLPPDAPSRAYLKMEQALAWQGLAGEKKLAGRTALELGCAPGGASFSLLNRGVSVIGVDTGAMDEYVLRFNNAEGVRFTHLETTAGALSTHRLPPKIDLLISDMNLAPPVILKYVEAVQRRVNAQILIVTLKLNDRSLEVKIPLYLKHFSQFAPGPVHATQLPANRREICLFSQA